MSANGCKGANGCQTVPHPSATTERRRHARRVPFVVLLGRHPSVLGSLHPSFDLYRRVKGAEGCGEAMS